MTARGTFVTAVLPGGYGKPRPALVVQADRYERLRSIIILPLTTEVHAALEPLRPSVHPAANGLQLPSQVMVDKVSAIPIAKIGKIIGAADDDLMERVDAALAQMLGL